MGLCLYIGNRSESSQFTTLLKFLSHFTMVGPIQLKKYSLQRIAVLCADEFHSVSTLFVLLSLLT